MSSDSSSLPALLGGTPVCPDGPPDWPAEDDAVRRALDGAFRSGHWGKYHGEHVASLEAELSAYHEVPFAWTCCSGTFSVELALRALQVGADDEVILAAYDYGGNFRSVLAVGAVPVLVDIDRDNWNMAPDEVERAIGPKTRAILVSHLHGGIVAMTEIRAIAQRRGLSIVEDAAQATGAIIDGRRAGTWGDVGTLSFGGSKLLTAGRGGCLITSNQEIHHRAKLYCERGNHVFPLSELQAAVLRPQLVALDSRNCTRARRVQEILHAIRDVPGIRPLHNRLQNAEPSYYKLGFEFDSERADGLSRDRFVAAVRAEGIACDAGFRSAHVGRSPSRFRSHGPLAESERAHHGMVVLHHPVLLGDDDAVAQVSRAIEKTIRHGRELQAAAPPEAP
jgi:perosamine synthetase